MSDQPSHPSHEHHSEAAHRDPDHRREPYLVAGRAGRRMYSLAALQERIEDEFIDEYADDSPALHAADTRGKRTKLILEVVDYVLGVESVPLEAALKAQLIERVYANLFGYGILDTLVSDPRVTTIAIHGADHVAVRYEHADLTPSGLMFDDENQLRSIVQRLLNDANVELREDEPILETGLTLAGRPASLSVAMPPVSPYVHVDMRLHPAQAPTLDDLIADNWLLPDAADLLRKIVHSPYGLMIVSEAESGKTTLLNAILQLLPAEGMLTVERAGELRPPAGAERLMPSWRYDDAERATFGQQIDVALARQPRLLVLDEIRADEPLTILPLLTSEDAPRQIWSVRGITDAKRLQSGVGMLARRANMARSEEMVAALYERLPFVVTVRKIKNRLQIFSIAEWQSRVDSDYPDYVMLLQYRDGMARPTGKTLARWLD